MKKNNIYNVDCYKGIKSIPDKSIDLIIIDPPYLINNHGGFVYNDMGKGLRKLNNELENANITNGYDLSLLDELVRVMKKINIYIWCNGKQIPDYLKYFVDGHKCSYDFLIWNKTNAMPLFNNKYLSDKEYCLYFRKGGKCMPENYNDAKTVYYLPINAKEKKKWNHPTIKPLDIIRTLIRNSSNKGDTVLDCFMGSGTTAIACLEEDRKFMGFEINKDYYNISMNRLEEYYDENNK